MDSALKQELSPPAPVTLNGRSYDLSYSMRAIIAFKQKTGESLFDAATYDKTGFYSHPEIWLALLWSGLHAKQPDGTWKSPFTIEQLEELVNIGNARELEIAVVVALSAHLPKAKKKEPVDGEASDPNFPSPPSEGLSKSENSGPSADSISD